LIEDSGVSGTSGLDVLDVSCGFISMMP